MLIQIQVRIKKRKMKNNCIHMEQKKCETGTEVTEFINNRVSIFEVKYLFNSEGLEIIVCDETSPQFLMEVGEK